MIINFCTDTIFASVIMMMFFTNARVVSHTSGQMQHDTKQLKTLAISNNTLAFLEIVLMMSMHQSRQLSMMTSLYVLLAIALVMINLFLTFVLEPTEAENHFISDHKIHHKKQSLVSKTVNELLLMTSKNH